MDGGVCVGFTSSDIGARSAGGVVVKSGVRGMESGEDLVGFCYLDCLSESHSNNDFGHRCASLAPPMLLRTRAKLEHHDGSLCPCSSRREQIGIASNLPASKPSASKVFAEISNTVRYLHDGCLPLWLATKSCELLSRIDAANVTSRFNHGGMLHDVVREVLRKAS